MRIRQKNLNITKLLNILDAKILSIKEGNKKIGLEILQMRETAAKFKFFTEEELEKFGIKQGFDNASQKLIAQIKTPKQISAQTSFIEKQKEILNNLTDEELKFLEIDENGNTIFHRNVKQIEKLSELFKSFKSDNKLDIINLVNNDLVSPASLLCVNNSLQKKDLDFFIENNLVNSNPIDIEGNSLLHILYNSKKTFSPAAIKLLIKMSLSDKENACELMSKENFVGVKPISLLFNNSSLISEINKNLLDNEEFLTLTHPIDNEGNTFFHVLCNIKNPILDMARPLSNLLLKCAGDEYSKLFTQENLNGIKPISLLSQNQPLLQIIKNIYDKYSSKFSVIAENCEKMGVNIFKISSDAISIESFEEYTENSDSFSVDVEQNILGESE